MSAIHEHIRGEAGLNDYRLVPGSRRELGIVRHAAAHVASVIWTPLPHYRVEFFAADDWLAPLAPGRTFDQARPVRILLASGLEDRELFSVACHELQHAADAISSDLTVAAREARAEALAELATELCRQMCANGPMRRDRK